MAETQVDGLKTPALTDGEFQDAVSDPAKQEEKKKPTALQVAQLLESKMHELSASLQKDETLFAEKMAKISSLIDELIREVNAK
ncbi:hypothetical protein METSCH_D06680 [Metschnikowia aff. pulcherrima]|uniref:Uncharacterized protein n=1 Tax=Metschnikowia aff. pulcherrima TaxID=2163413 RepID=A0A4P6XQB2_9ASCO|nr:hypothetical protein METSCH_D06680 [Metschnikowia aff. pulcherrima]